MAEKEKKWINSMDICIGIGIISCLFLCHFVPQIQTLAACTAVVMCMQDTEKITFQAGITRLKGVLCGGILGILVVLLDGVVQNTFVFYLFCGVGIILNLMLCRVVKMVPVTSRVSAITFCLVVLLVQGNSRIVYALNRFIGTLAGALVAFVVAVIYYSLNKNKEK